jgi:phage/plasmid-like protein (TIGR03299 family)
MAHELEEVNGEASFVSYREVAWHGLGTVIEHEATTREMLELANLHDWDIQVNDVPLAEDETSAKTFYKVTRRDPSDHSKRNVLGVVGERYSVLQNEELFDFGDMLLDGGRWETAGSIKNGTQVFGSLALERETVLDPTGVSDRVNNYLLVSTGHDGSLAVQVSVTPVRVVCANTLGFALSNVKQSFRLRHTQSLTGRVAQAREALELAGQYIDEFDKSMSLLIQAEMTRDQFDSMITLAYPKPEADVRGSMAKWETKRETLFDLLDSPTNRDIANTYWGGLNAMNERLMWGRPTRAGKVESMLASASGFDVATNVENNRLLSLVMSQVA